MKRPRDQAREIIVALMDHTGIHQAELARRLHRNRMTVNTWVRGANLTLDTLEKIVGELGFDVVLAVTIRGDTDETNDRISRGGGRRTSGDGNGARGSGSEA